MIPEVIQSARNRLGFPYSMSNRWGDPPVDCSSLVWIAYAEGGLPLDGRTTNGTLVDFPSGPQIGLADVRPGDLVYKTWDGAGYQHVGMVINAPYVIEASSYYGVVERANLNTWEAASRPYPELEVSEVDAQARADIAALSQFNQQRFDEIVGLMNKDATHDTVDAELRKATVELADGLKELTNLLSKNAEADEDSNERMGERIEALERKLEVMPADPVSEVPGWFKSILDSISAFFNK